MGKEIDLDALVKTIAEESPAIEDIYLFGSYLRGDAGEESDVDIALILRNELDWRSRREILNHLYLKSAQQGVPAEFHVKSRAVFEAEQKIPGLSKTITEEGKLLWTRS